MYKITTLTPVHIGSGQKLSRFDTVFDNNRLYVIDVNKVIEVISNNKEALNRFAQGNFEMKNFLKEHRINYDSVKKYSLPAPTQVKGKEIFEFIKTGLGKPFIPGSSIKGAIRTVFLWHLVNESDQQKIREKFENILQLDKIKKMNADDELDKYIFGNTPNYDFMRVLQVSDAEFDISGLRVDEVKILELRNHDTYGWWKYNRPNNRVLDNPMEAISIFIESISEECSLEVEIKIDEFLLKNKTAITQLGFNSKEHLFTQLAEKCNKYSLEYINSEIVFFSKCKMKKMEEFYQKLKNKINDNNSFLLHLGWGIGWKAITGNYISSKEIFNRIREKFRLGKGTIFPKTRKIVFRNNEPLYPLGWILLQKI